MKMTLGGVAAPGSSRLNKTGGWRVFYPEFLHLRCTDCGLCQKLCPEGCIFREEKKKYHADLDYCKGCGICAEECPVHDIEMRPEVR
jgi:pyruvate ferredoxin oxidoreductase delta subunit